MSHVKFLVIPAENTPYAHGCFIFDAFFPAKYPDVCQCLHRIIKLALVDVEALSLLIVKWRKKESCGSAGLCGWVDEKFVGCTTRSCFGGNFVGRMLPNSNWKEALEFRINLIQIKFRQRSRLKRLKSHVLIRRVRAVLGAQLWLDRSLVDVSDGCSDGGSGSGADTWIGRERFQCGLGEILAWIDNWSSGTVPSPSPKFIGR